jgi:hypothetical protein
MDPEAQLEGFIGRYSDSVAGQIRAARSWMRARLPGATELVYDNYNALVIGYGANDKIGGLVFSIAAYPRWVSLFFTRGADLDDPTGRLEGEGARIRHIVLAGPQVLEAPDVAALMAQALAIASPPIDPAATPRTLIKSVSAKQRPRRPA